MSASATPGSKKRKLNDNKAAVTCPQDDSYNICQEVLKSCKLLLEDHKEKEVWIDESAIDIEVAQNGDQYQKQSIAELKSFNEYDAELTLRSILVLDALNFCFWPLKNYEYEHLAEGLKHTLLTDPTAFDPQKLMTLKSSTLSQWLLSKFAVNNENQDEDEDEDVVVKIPLIEERTRLLNEVGRVMHCEFGGSAVQLVRSVHGSAVQLVQLMSQKFRGFADHCICPWNGKQVFFYKRAQIFVADIYAAFKGQFMGDFYDIDQLTCFADYRVPQLLRELNILKYSPRLCDVIDGETVIGAGSKDEMLIRAAMICAVDKLKDKLNAKRKQNNKDDENCKPLIVIEIDWCLWNRGEQLNAQKKLKPHHKTLTVYY